MTAGEWRACTDPAAMLAFARPRASARRLRLFACACARRVWDRLDPPGRWAVKAAEHFADRTATTEELAAAHTSAHEAALAAVSGWGANRRHDHARFAAASCALPGAGEAAVAASRDMFRRADELFVRPVEEAVQADHLRCVFGGLFGAGVAHPEWLTATVLALAGRVDATGEFEALPILADALQDAGCDDAGVLKHLRSDGSHARGCWALDRVLGRP